MGSIVSAADLFSLLTDGAVSDLDAYVSRLTSGNSGAPENIFWHKEPRVAGAAAATPIASQWIDLWEYEGSPLSHGAFPGAFANPTNATAGAMMQTDVVTGSKRLLIETGISTQVGVLMIYDRLAHMGGLDATVTTAQNINGGSDAGTTRYTNGVGNQLWVTIGTQIGATATTITASYKNGAGSAKTTQPVVFGNTNRREAQRMIPLSLAVGENTVKSVTSVTVLASTTTAGSFGVVIAHPLVYIPIVIASSGTTMGFLDGPIPAIPAGACLSMAFLPNTTTALTTELFSQFVENL